MKPSLIVHVSEKNRNQSFVHVIMDVKLLGHESVLRNRPLSFNDLCFDIFLLQPNFVTTSIKDLPELIVFLSPPYNDCDGYNDELKLLNYSFR